MLFKNQSYSGNDNVKLARRSLVIAALVISFSGLLIRHIENADQWTIIYYRALAFSFAVFLCISFQHKSKVMQKFKDVGRKGIAAGVILGLTNITYIISIMNTTVANTLFTVSLIPFITATLAFLIIKEKITKGTFLAMLLAFFGTLIMFGGSMIGGQAFGTVMALITACLFSMFTILLRLNREIEMLPSLVLGGLTSLLIAIVVIGLKPEISLNDMLICFILGGILSGFANIIFTLATRYIPAAEATFYMFIEFALGPFWVWLLVNETPSNATLFGGIIIFGALLFKAKTEKNEKM